MRTRALVASALFAVFAVLFAASREAAAVDIPLGVVVADAATPRSQANTATTFTIPNSALVVLQPDVACCYRWTSTADAGVTCAAGTRLAAHEKWPDKSGSARGGLQYLQVVPATSTDVCGMKVLQTIP